MLKGTPQENLRSELGIIIICGGSNMVPISQVTEVEGVDTSKVGSYTATITYADDKTATMPVDVVDEFVESWPGLKRRCWKRGTDLSDVISGELIRLKSEGEVPVTADMITGWDSSKEGELEIELRYKSFSKKYSIVICKDYEIKSLTDVDISGNDYVSFYIPVEKGKSWRREGTEIELVKSDGSSVDVSLTDTALKVTGFDKNKTGFQLLDFSCYGFTSKLLFYVYDPDDKPIVNRYYYDISKVFYKTPSVTLKVPNESGTGLGYRDVYIDGTLSEENVVPAQMIPGFDYENIKTVESNAYDIIRNLVRAGNLKDIYVITDTFNVGGKSYSKKTYIGYYE